MKPKKTPAQTAAPPKKSITKRPSTDMPSLERDAYFLHSVARSTCYPPHTSQGGKWLLFVPRGFIDEVWNIIVGALRDGKLGDQAKVSTARPNPNSVDPSKHVICVYTYDSDDLADVRRVRAALRDLGFDKPIAYKTDQATREGQYEARGHQRVPKYYE